MLQLVRTARSWVALIALGFTVSVVGCGDTAAKKSADPAKPADSKPADAKPEDKKADEEKPSETPPTTPEAGSATKPKAGGGVEVPEEK